MRTARIGTEKTVSPDIENSDNGGTASLPVQPNGALICPAGYGLDELIPLNVSLTLLRSQTGGDARLSLEQKPDAAELRLYGWFVAEEGGGAC